MTNLPPTFTEETKKSLEEKIMDIARAADRGDDRFYGKELARLIPYILSRTSAAYDLGRAETLKEVREMCEGMKRPYPCEKYPNGGGYCNQDSCRGCSDIYRRRSDYDCDRSVDYNAALDEITRRLTQ